MIWEICLLFLLYNFCIPFLISIVYLSRYMFVYCISLNFSSMVYLLAFHFCHLAFYEGGTPILQFLNFISIPFLFRFAKKIILFIAVNKANLCCCINKNTKKSKYYSFFITTRAGSYNKQKFNRCEPWRSSLVTLVKLQQRSWRVKWSWRWHIR